MDLKYTSKHALGAAVLSLGVFTTSAVYANAHHRAHTNAHHHAHQHTQTYTMPEWVSDLVPYAGADAQIKHIDWVKDYGGNLYKRDHLQGNVFGGVGVTRHVGLEMGYELTPVRTNRTTLNFGNVFGQPIGPSGPTRLQSPPITFDSKFQIKGWHINVMGYLPVSDHYKLELVTGIGFSRAKIFQSTTLFSDNVSTQKVTAFSRTFMAKKSVLRATIGLQRMVSESCGVRFLINWMNTSKFNMIASLENPASVVKVRDSYGYGAGVFLKF